MAFSDSITISPPLLSTLMPYFANAGVSAQIMQVCKAMHDAMVLYFREAQIHPAVKVRMAAETGNRALIKTAVGSLRRSDHAPAVIKTYLEGHDYKNLRRLVEAKKLSTIGTLFNTKQLRPHVGSRMLSNFANWMKRNGRPTIEESDGYRLALRITTRRIEATRRPFIEDLIRDEDPIQSSVILL